MRRGKHVHRVCQCVYCLYERSSDRSAIDSENDKLIGWPNELKLDTQDEYQLQLCGFSRKSRDDVMRALLILTSHGIRLTDLNAGVANGSVEEQEKEREEASGNNTKEDDVEPSAHELNNMQLVRVGRNFVDFEVMKHVTAPSYHYTADEGPYDVESGQRPRWRVREMGRDELATGPSTSSHNIYRVFSNENRELMGDWEFNDSERGRWWAIERTVDSMEKSIYFAKRECTDA